jgi:hypothetical protein
VPVFWRQDGQCVAHGQCKPLRESHGESPVVPPYPSSPCSSPYRAIELRTLHCDGATALIIITFVCELGVLARVCV